MSMERGLSEQRNYKTKKERLRLSVHVTIDSYSRGIRNESREHAIRVALRPPYTEQLLSLRRKQLLSQVSYDKSPENRIVSISRNMSHTCFRRLATARLCTIHGETFVARQKLLRVWWPLCCLRC